MVIFGHGVIPADRQNKVSSCRIACTLQTTTMQHLPLDWSIHMELGIIIHEGWCRWNFVIVDEVAWDGCRLHLKSIKQGEFLLDHTHVTNNNHLLTTWSTHRHIIGRYLRWGMISTAFHHSRLCCDRRWCYQSRQNKVSSCQLVCILQSVTMCLPWNWEISSTRDDMDGISPFSTTFLLFLSSLFGARLGGTRAYECFSTGC
jgi:hypothetical protein